MNRKTFLCLAVPAGAAAAAGLPRNFDVTRYRILTPKVSRPIHIAMLADLHDNYYGRQMQVLVSLLKNEKPDLILMPGDMLHDHRDNRNSFCFLQQLQEFPVFYSPGNHEEFLDDYEADMQKLIEMGIHVLQNQTETITIRDSVLEIAGLRCGVRADQSPFSAEEVNGLFHTDHFRILLSHQPHWTALYQNVRADLILAGHAHGGQWIIPFTGQGLYAPNQGLFPKITSGLYTFPESRMIVTRGICWQSYHIPKLYNNPELIMITLSPREEHA